MRFGGRWRHRSYLETGRYVCQQGGLGFSGRSAELRVSPQYLQAGYRYEGRSIGHGIDGSGDGFSLGSILQRGDDTRWQFSLRNFEIRADVGVPLTQPCRSHAPPQEIVEISVLHARPLWIGELRAGLGYRDVTGRRRHGAR